MTKDQHAINGGKGQTRRQIAERAVARAEAVLAEKRRLLEAAIDAEEQAEAKAQERKEAKEATAKLPKEQKARIAAVRGLIAAGDLALARKLTKQHDLPIAVPAG